MKVLHKIAWVLVIIGGLNWLLVVFGWELGQNLFGGMDSALSKIVYLLVGISAIFEIVTHRNNCKMCVAGSSMSASSDPNM